jgi:hypothetical protein
VRAAARSGNAPVSGRCCRCKATPDVSQNANVRE